MEKIKALCSALLLAAVLMVQSTWAQIECNCPQGNSCPDISVLTPNTSAQFVNLSCLNSGNAAMDSGRGTWEWFRLDTDYSRTLYRIEDGISSDSDTAAYLLPVQCNNTGFYQALYRQSDMGGNGVCVFSCIFIVEVEEVRPHILRSDLSQYPNINGSTPASPSDNSIIISGREETTTSVGTCGNKLNLESMCLVEDVDGTWFRNGVRFDPRLEQQNYIVSSSSELLIRNLTRATAGYYVCVINVNQLGQFLTVDANVSLSPSDSPSTSMAALPDVTTVKATGSTDNSLGILRVWQFGLIIGAVSLIILVLLLTGVVLMARVTARRRREHRNRKKSYSNIKYTRTPAATTTRAKSVLEEIQMMEEAHIEEEVDSGEGGPVEILFNSILFEEQLHRGTFKVVHHGTVNQPLQGMLGTQVAIKRLKDEKSELGYEELMNEAYLLRSLQEKAGSHPNVVSLVGLTTQGSPTCLLLEFVPHGTLQDLLELLRTGPIPEWYMKFVRDTLRGAYHKHASGDLMNIVIQVAEGMKFLTDHGFIHRDLSVRNVLMGDRLNIKIANPGMHHEGYYYVVSEREHFLQDMAPECLWEKCYSVCSDVWSFGILVYRTVTLNSTPFPDVAVDQLHGRLVGGERPQLLASFSNELYFLLQRCWQFVATERPSFSEILSDLSHMAEKPTRHIILKASKDHTSPGYISDNGQVFLRPLPPHALEEDEPPQKKSRRNSGTMRSLISSIDDTVYTRETAETMLDFTQSENENDFNNYDQYLKGDLPSGKRRSYEETDTSGNDVDPSTREWVQSTSSKKSSKSQDGTAAADTASRGSGSKKKKRRASSGKDKPAGKKNTSQQGCVNKTYLSLQKTSQRDSGELSTDGAPSTTEEEKEGATSDMSGSEAGGSQSELVRL